MPTGWIIFGMLVVGIGIGTVIMRRKIRKFSRSVFGTNTLREGLEQQQMMLSQTPKSVSSMTKIYLPQITREHPEFDWPEMRKRAQNVCLSWLQSIDQKNAELLSEGSSELKESLRQYLVDQANTGIRELYRDINIHDCVISRYRKEPGICIVEMQLSLESFHTAEQYGKLVRGHRSLKEQSVWSVEAAYIQDRDVISSAGGAVGIQCPNCGAPISTLVQKRCEYCGGAVAELNIRAWQFQNVKNTGA